MSGAADEAAGLSDFQMLHPIKSGGKFPPLPARFFRSGVSSTEPSTWGVTASEVVDVWLRHSEHDGDAISRARHEKVQQLRREILGQEGAPCMEEEVRMRLKLQLIADSDVLPSEEASFAFLRDIVDLAYPRLVAAGYMSGKEDTSSWPKKLWELYLYDKRKQVSQCFSRSVGRSVGRSVL